MPDFGLTPKGFHRKRYMDVIDSMEARAKNLFGENINLTERSPLGLFLRIVAWSIGILWQVAENVYNSAFVSTAEGNDLDKVALYVGITRRPAEHAAGEVTLTGNDGTVIPENFLVATSDNIFFATTAEATILAGTETVPIYAIEAGTSGNVPAQTITEIINPTAGIDAVINEFAIKGGRNRETDAELRERYTLSVAKGGASTIESIRASLLEVPGVRAAQVLENNTLEADAAGQPPKSVGCLLLGGEAQDIARTILKTKAAGIQAYGTECETVLDDAGQPHTIGFTYAAEVPVYVEVEITRSTAYPVDGDDRIRTAIIQYIGGQDGDGSIYTGLSMSQSVVYTRIIDACYSVPGVEDISLLIGTTEPPAGTGNIPIGVDEAAETDWQRIVVK